jgi:phospholipid/cholesterol/gamma-HCH transport system substrate-binding protein
VKNKELKVGIFVALCIVLLYFGFNFLKGIDFFSSTNKYYAVYDNVDQLAASNPVLVNGFAVGRVSRISILQRQQNKVLVELDIDSKIVLGDSTTATLNSDFLGSKSILLTIGKVTTPLKPKDTVIAKMAKGTFDMLEETATPVANNIQTTLRKLNTVLDILANESSQLDIILKKFQSTPDLLNTSLSTATAKMEELSGSMKGVANNLNETLADLKPTLGNFKTISDSLKQIQLNQTIVKTHKAIDELNKTLKQLSKGDNTASKLLTDDSLYNNLNRLLVNLDSLAVHFNDNPKHFMAPLGKSKRKIERDRRREEERKKQTP